MQALIDYLEGGHCIDEFLDDFPTVSRGLAAAALEQAKVHLMADAGAACDDLAPGTLNSILKQAGLKK